MSFSGTIIVRKKDALIPEDFLKLAFEKNPTFLSSAFIDDDKTMTTDAIADHILGDLSDAQELVKDRASVFYMGNFKEPEESLQPFFALKNDKDEAELVVFLDGEFSNYEDAKSANSHAFHAFNKYFKPQVDKWYKKGGLKNVLEELEDSMTKENIRNSFMGRGAVVFFAVTGETILIQAKNPDYAEFPWGYVTNSYGYKEAVKTSVPETGKKKIGLFGKKKAEQVSPKSGEDGGQVEAPPKPAPAPAAPDKEKEETPVAAEADTHSVVIGWKPEFHVGISRKQKAKAYKACPFYDLWFEQYKESKSKMVETEGVWLPEGYKNQVPLFAKVAQADIAGYLSDGCFLKDAPGKVVSNGTKKEQGYPPRLPAEQVEQNRANKDTSVHNKEIETQSLAQEEPGYKPFSPEPDKELGSEVRKWFSDATKNKFIAVGSQEIALDPAKIQSLEKQIPSALGLAGMELADFFRISKPGHVDLARKFPVWYAAVMCEMLPKLVKLGILTKPTSTKPAEEVGKEPAETPIAEEKAPITAPKKSIFAKKGKAA